MIWEGLISVVYTECKEDNILGDIPESIKPFKKKLDLLYNSKTLKEIQDNLTFTLEDRNYLNSPLLDEIYGTIFSDNPANKALSKCAYKALHFYIDRNVFPKIDDKFIRKQIAKDNSKTIEFLCKDSLSKMAEMTDVLTHFCIENNAVKCLKVIADNNLVPEDDPDFFPHAIVKGNLEIIKILLEVLQLDMNALCNAIYHSITDDMKEVTEFLAVKTDYFKKDTAGDLIKTMVNMGDDVSCILTAINYGATITRNHLIACAESGSVETLDFLLKNSKINVPKGELLEAAIINENSEVMMYLRS